MIVKPRKEQGSEETKNAVTEKVKIKTLPVGINRLSGLKGNKGSIIIRCESGKEVKQLKSFMKAFGEEFDTIIPKNKKPKIKVVGIDRFELELDDQTILDAIKVQNEMNEEMDNNSAPL